MIETINFVQKLSKQKLGSLNTIKLCKVIIRIQETNKKVRRK